MIESRVKRGGDYTGDPHKAVIGVLVRGCLLWRDLTAEETGRLSDDGRRTFRATTGSAGKAARLFLGWRKKAQARQVNDFSP